MMRVNRPCLTMFAFRGRVSSGSLAPPCDAITDFFRSARRRRRALGDGPDEAGQLTGDRGSDDIGRVCPSSVPAWSLASSCAVRHELRTVGENDRDDYAPLSRRLGSTPGLPMPDKSRRCGDFIAAPARRCGLTNVGPGHIPAHNGQRYALTRGGVRCMSHNLTPATTATMIPVTTWTQVAVAWTANQTAHADTATQTPSKRLIHSSHSADANSAASATTPIATPLSQAFQLAAVLGTKPKIHGVRNSQAPKTRLITSASVSLFSSRNFPLRLISRD